MAAPNSSRAANSRKWHEPAEWPGLEPEDPEPTPRRIEYHPSAKMSSDFARLTSMIRSTALGPIEVVPQGTPDPSADRRRQWSADFLGAWNRGEIELGGRIGLLGPIRPI